MTLSTNALNRSATSRDVREPHSRPSDLPAPWYVTPIPACGPPASSWASAPERDEWGEEPGGLGHPLLPLVLPSLPADRSEDVPAVPAAPPPPGATTVTPADRAESAGGRELPDATNWSTWLARMLIEVIHGRRPVGQLARWADERVLATVVLRTRQLKLAARVTRPSGGAQTAVLGSVRVQRPRSGAIEAMATERGDRPTAFAFRLETQGERWLCTAVDFGPQTPQPA